MRQARGVGVELRNRCASWKKPTGDPVREESDLKVSVRS